jgi:hypothetical protein
LQSSTNIVRKPDIWKLRMHLQIDQIIGILVTVVLGMTGWGLFTLVKLDAKMSGFHQWLIQHEKLDDIRMDNITQKFEALNTELREPIKEIREQLGRIQDRVQKIEGKMIQKT